LPDSLAVDPEFDIALKPHKTFLQLKYTHSSVYLGRRRSIKFDASTSSYIVCGKPVYLLTYLDCAQQCCCIIPPWLFISIQRHYSSALMHSFDCCPYLTNVLSCPTNH